MTTQYEYRKAKEAKARIAEAAGNNGYVVLDGGKSNTKVREVMRTPGQPLALPFDEVTPAAANPQLYGPDGAPTRKTVQQRSAVNEADEHYGLTPTHEQEDSDD